MAFSIGQASNASSWIDGISLEKSCWTEELENATLRGENKPITLQIVEYENFEKSILKVLFDVFRSIISWILAKK